VIEAPHGTYNPDDHRGTWVWCNGTPFQIDGDVAERGSNAFMLKAGLDAEYFVWRPKNPQYDTVSPLLKDGVTANPNFNDAGNPDAVGGGQAQMVGDACRHFNVSTVIATTKKAKTKVKAKDEK
jgi:hypothetical protein